MSPSSAAPPRGLTRRLSPLGEHSPGGPLRRPRSRSGACTRKEWRGPSTLTSLCPGSTGLAALGNSSLPPRGCPRRKSAPRGRSSPSGWGGAGGGGKGRAAWLRRRARREPTAATAGAPLRREAGSSFSPKTSPVPVPWSHCRVPCAQPLDIKVHAGASQSPKKERQPPPVSSPQGRAGATEAEVRLGRDRGPETPGRTPRERGGRSPVASGPREDAPE